MTINTECFNDVLLFIQNNISFENLVVNNQLLSIFNFQTIPFDKIINSFKDKYTSDEVRYSLVKLKELCFIECSRNSNDNTGINDGVKDITVAGHRFLHKLKQNTNILEW